MEADISSQAVGLASSADFSLVNLFSVLVIELLLLITSDLGPLSFAVKIVKREEMKVKRKKVR